MDLEKLYDAWERYNDLLRRCPHHGLPLWLQVQTFYNGVNPSTRQIIDAAASGTINNKTAEEAYEFIEEMSLNNYQWQVIRTKPTKTTGVYNVDSVTILSNQVELLNKKIDGLLGSMQVHPIMQCEASGGGSSIPEYQPYGHNMENEQLNYLGNNPRSQNNPYSNTYNAGWRVHPNFSWGSQGNQRPPPPSGFQQPPYQQEKKLNLEEMLPKFIAVSKNRFQNTETALKNQQASIQWLETQIGQLSKLISNDHKVACQVILNLTQGNSSMQLMFKMKKDSLSLSQNQGKKLCRTKMPNTKKFLREFLANKQKLDEASHVKLNAVCSAILQNKLANKLKDPGSFTIPYLIGSLNVNNALTDLGASINVMPYKMFKQLGLGKPKQTGMIIQLADKIIRFPRGIIEDVLVKIDKFIFRVDFIVLDIEEDNNTPLILGKPFLATAKMIIDVGTSELTLRVGDETITLQARNSGNTSKIEDNYPHQSTKIDNMTQPTLQELSLKEVHESCSSNNRGATKATNREARRMVGDKVLLGAADPHIVTANPNEEIPLTVLSIFPFGTVEKLARACDTPVSNTHGRTCQINTGVGEANKARHGRVTRPCAPTRPRFTMSSSRKKASIPASKKRKGASSFSGPTMEICHPFLQFPNGPQEELFQILRAQPLTVGCCIDWAVVEQVQLADAIRALLTTDLWEPFFGIIEPTYLELTMKLCSTFHLQTVMANHDDLGMVQFRLGGLVRQLSVLEFGAALGLYKEEFKEENDLDTLNRHIHYSPS
ncbi:hypothetical protein CXB51_017266 [Gossypium anomalum]|uniref:Retrotransposon gag domain-containing protein n=1 Tax=Gossypium anomalum TaxID=47600 RepID=A0A8J6D2W2_9ROSI|nr:hypothetical protein CXB51_017266 [Gossypium anomalum]